MDRVHRKEDGEDGCDELEWSENGQQERKLLRRGPVEPKIPTQVQMAQSDGKVGPWGTAEEGATEVGVGSRAKGRGVLLWEDAKKQDDQRDRSKQGNQRQECVG